MLNLNLSYTAKFYRVIYEVSMLITLPFIYCFEKTQGGVPRKIDKQIKITNSIQ